ncbi:ATP-binding protein [Pseudoxanthobacter sp. M-2]|uniref:ATP-binding protein n=1 Tax=Pseudoxanthobacter sp. M-2 TaxID=3078754 RepID=UPI0038FC908E
MIENSQGMPRYLDGFDPLSENMQDDLEDRSIFQEATKRIVSNILKSYTNYFDVFSELIQNGLDAIDARVKAGQPDTGHISVNINCIENTINVVDNGIGMDARELRYCFRPSVSFKNRRESRGHKGVGATFLAYGFSSISVATKKGGTKHAIKLSGGRAWAEEIGHTHSRPRFVEIDGDDPELDGLASGTSITIHIGNGNRPDLTWWNATSAYQWLEMLKIRTPLGGVYLAGAPAPKTRATVSVVDRAGQRTVIESENVEYPWPHEIGGSILPKVKSVDEVARHVRASDGDSSRIAAEFKNLSAMYEIWTKDNLLDESDPSWSKIFDEAEERLIRLHDVAIYGCFASSAKSWTQYQAEVLKIRRSPLLLRGGMQIASDFMVQGDLNVIPLTSTIGYQANTHILIHFRDGNPDMGRKVFQPEIKALAEKTSRQAVNIFKRYIHLMREDSGSPPAVDETDLFEWKLMQKKHVEENPLELAIAGRRLSYASTPRSEQDVVAIFHELVGMEIIRGFDFISTSQYDRYDSCFRTYYIDDERFRFSPSINPLGVARANIAGKLSMPNVLEYKFNLDGLIADFEKEEKFDTDVQLVVCWEIGKAYESRYNLSSRLVGEEGSSRRYFGSTHALWYERQMKFEIICLSDLIQFLRDPEVVIVNHQAIGTRR